MHIIQNLKTKRGKDNYMKRYEEILRKNNPIQVTLALELLLDHGRRNLTNDKYVDVLREALKEDKSSNLLSLDFKMRAVDITRELASLETKDLCKFIQDYNKMLNNRKRER